jgi:RNA polymerase sigma factor (sigma-70 family)
VGSRAIEMLVAHRDKFVGFLVKRIGERQLAEDLFQDAFTRSLDRIEQVRNDESVVAWFYRTLRNSLADHHRRLGTSGRALERLARELDDAAAPPPELHESVCRCISRLADDLKAEYADALREIDVNGMSLTDYAAARGITANLAGVRVFRARKALLGSVERTCGHCAQTGGCGDDCTCAHHAVPSG